VKSSIYRRKFSRVDELSGVALAKALRMRRQKFAGGKAFITIVGDHIADAIRAHGIYERVYLEFVRDHLIQDSYSNAIAIDVGANIGNHSLFFADHFDRVIAFEPNPLARSLLALNVEMNGAQNIEVKPVGLSNKAHSTELTYEPSNLGAATAHGDGAESPGKQASIDLVVGDDILAQCSTVGLIKIDVEGAEPFVIEGLMKTIQRHRPIIMMEQLATSIDSGRGSSASSRLLEGLGYSAWELREANPMGRAFSRLSSLLFGHTDYRFMKIEKLEKRDYNALFFLPNDKASQP
jgi:FkbM family methyltransferase